MIVVRVAAFMPGYELRSQADAEGPGMMVHAIFLFGLIALFIILAVRLVMGL